MPRWTKFPATSLASLAALYLAGANWFIHRVATGLLEVGPLAGPLAAEERPNDPFEVGYRGTPAEAFGLAFEEVRLDTPLDAMPAWFVPGDRELAAL